MQASGNRTVSQPEATSRGNIGRGPARTMVLPGVEPRARARSNTEAANRAVYRRPSRGKQGATSRPGLADLDLKTSIGTKVDGHKFSETEGPEAQPKGDPTSCCLLPRYPAKCKAWSRGEDGRESRRKSTRKFLVLFLVLGGMQKQSAISGAWRRGSQMEDTWHMEDNAWPSHGAGGHKHLSGTNRVPAGRANGQGASPEIM